VKSAVAGILDANGGLRVVVTQPWLFRNHLGKGERLFVLPRTLVQEPLSTTQAEPLIEAVTRYVQANQ
jgi:hypothetical protein